MPKSKGTSRGSTQKNRSLSSARPLPNEEADWGHITDYKKELPRAAPYNKSRPEKVHNVEMIPERITAPQEMTLAYAGAVQIPITSSLRLIRPEDDTPRGIWPVFRLMVSR